MTGSMTIDPHLIDLLTYVVSGVVVALVSIIVWLAKGKMNKLDAIAENQAKATTNTALIKQSVTSLVDDLDSIKESIKDIPKVKQDVAVLSKTVDLLEKQLEKTHQMIYDTSKHVEKIKENLNDN